MNTIQLRDYAELALAGYGQFDVRGPPEVDRLKTLNGDAAAFTDAQAKRFADRFEIATPTFEDSRSPGGSGNTSFDVTVFKGHKGADDGKMFISFRGVAQRLSSPSDLSAVAQIGAYGAAVDQIVAMHNWWLRVSTPVGATSPNLVRQYAFSPLLNLLTRAADVASTGELAAFFPAGSPIRVAVTGSSLGGHLAMAFATLFPANTVEAVAFNAPGFPDRTRVGWLFAGLGGVVPDVGNPLITNVQSREANNAGDQLDILAGYPSGNFPGRSLVVPIEDQYLTDVAVPKWLSWNHDQRQLTDGR